MGAVAAGATLAVSAKAQYPFQWVHSGKFYDCGLHLCWDCITTNSGAQVCPGCMRQHYAATGIANPFSDSHDTNCEGTWPIDPLNAYYHWAANLSDPCWTSFFCFGGAWAAQTAIDQCSMNHPDNPNGTPGGDIYCIYQSGPAAGTIVWGVYITSGQIDLDALRGRINMGLSGEPPIGTPDPYASYWQEFIPYIAHVSSDWLIDGYWHPWKTTYAAAGLYLADAYNAGVPASPDERESMASRGSGFTVWFAEDVFAHSLNNWQMDDGGGGWDSHSGWGDGSLEIDLKLDENGWPVYPWADFDANPRFNYWLGLVVWPFVGTPIAVESESWGSIKSGYQQ